MTTIDLRDGYRIQVQTLLIPHGFGARLYVPSGRRWKQVGPLVVSMKGPEEAAADLALAINTGRLADDLEFIGGPR